MFKKRGDAVAVFDIKSNSCNNATFTFDLENALVAHLENSILNGSTRQAIIDVAWQHHRRHIYILAREITVPNVKQ